MNQTSDVTYIGVDGGGTRCRVRLCDHRGEVLASVEGGTANVYLDFALAVRNIRDAVTGALARAGVPPGVAAPRRIGLGLAGVSGPAAARKVQAALADLGEVTVTHDGDVACLGAHAGQDGGLIIAGTGSGGIARVGAVSTTIGGRGFIMGDDGSGARLGLEALRRALRAHDGLEAATPLAVHLMSRFGDDPVAVIDWARAARSSDFGAYAPVVFDFAARGDPAALDLVGAAATAIGDLGTALMRLGAGRLSLVGGMAAAIRPFLPEAIAAVLHDPLLDAEAGALLLAGCPLPGGRVA